MSRRRGAQRFLFWFVNLYKGAVFCEHFEAGGTRKGLDILWQ